jgi:amino acid transporter
MQLTDTGEARIRGYLFILGRSLRSFLPREVVQDALRELESHVRERIEQVGSMPNEQAALERVLGELGPPLRVAQAYASEIAVDEAITTGSLRAVARALWRLATTTVAGFFAALALFIGYVFGVAFLAIAALKPLFPQNVGLIVVDGVPRAFGGLFPMPAGAEVWGGYWVIPICVAIGLGFLVLTHRGARAFLSWWRARLAAIRGSER